MSFQPVIPFGGYAGWRFLGRTMERQQQVFNKSPGVQGDLDYFAAKIGKVTSADQLVSDYRLLKVALGAFGLQSEIGNKFFIRKVLSEGVSDPKALANRLADKSYLKLAEAFGFGGTGAPHTQDKGFAEKIATAYRSRSFEAAVGEQNQSMRLALNLERELADLAGRDSSDNAKWFSILGSAPLRKVFDTAFGLPTAFAALDLDRQLEVYKTRARQMFGSDSPSQFADAAQREKLTKRFLIRSDLGPGLSGTSSAQAALTLLQR